MPTPSRKTVEPAPIEYSWGAACEKINEGEKVTRATWGDGACVFLHASVLHLRKADGSLHTLIVSEGDMSATDWTVVRQQ